MDESPSGRFRWHEAGDDASGADLLRECGEKLTDREIWARFQHRFQGLIFLYLLRALRYQSMREDVSGIVPDLAQEVYIRLVRRDGHALRSFRGTTEFSVMAFLARFCTNVVADHFQSQTRDKRKAQVISIEDARLRETRDAGGSRPDPNSLSSILAWIDIERIVESDADRKNARRNALIFKLHHIDGLSALEISQVPGFGLTRGGVETVLARLRKKIQE
jgi:RNA polymerase sigma factor (sigma-70 family)